MELSASEIDRLAAAAVDVLRPDGRSALLLLCEHAGAEVPVPWGQLGLDPAILATHYACDPGTADLTRRMAEALDAPAILSRYSRIFLDYNRYCGDWDQMRPDLGGIPVPGNLAIAEAERALRHAVAAEPVARAIAPRLTGRRAVVSVHSFTPVMAGHRRPVDIGLLWKEDSAFLRRSLDEIAARAEPLGLRVAENQPYDWRLANGYSLETHAMAHGLPCYYIEVNAALFADPETSAAVGDILSDAVGAAVAWLAPIPA